MQLGERYTSEARNDCGSRKRKVPPANAHHPGSSCFPSIIISQTRRYNTGLFRRLTRTGYVAVFVTYSVVYAGDSTTAACQRMGIKTETSHFSGKEYAFEMYLLAPQ